MLRDAYKRIRKYEKKINPEVIKTHFEEQKPAMVEQVSSIFTEIVSVEEAAKTILDAEGVSIALYPMYLSYVREIWRLQRKFGGNVLFNYVRETDKKWTGRALSATVLERLRNDIFGIILPPAP